MAPKQSVQAAHPPPPYLYALFFLYIEPVATAAGAYMGWFQPDEYLRLTNPSTFSTLLGATTREKIVLSQLANLYFVFALNEALVLRATNDRKVWSIFLLGLLIADFGHLWSVHHLGDWALYYSFWRWNAIDWGNLAFVYVGASMRTAFLLGIGLPAPTPSPAKKQKN